MISIIPVGVLMLWAVPQSYENRLVQSLFAERQTIELIGNEIDQDFVRIGQLLSNKSIELDWSTQNTAGILQIKSILQSIVEKENAITALFVLNKQGVITGTQKLSVNNLSIGFNHAQTGRPFINVSAQKNDQHEIQLFLPINKGLGQILLAKINFTQLQGWSRLATNSNDGIVLFIVDQQGRLLSSLPEYAIKTGVSLNHQGSIKQALSGDSLSVKKIYKGLTEQRVLTNNVLIPSLNWFLISEIEYTRFLKPIRHYLILILLSSFLSLTIVIWFASRGATRFLTAIQGVCHLLESDAGRQTQKNFHSFGIAELDQLSHDLQAVVHKRNQAEDNLTKNKQRIDFLHYILAELIRTSNLSEGNIARNIQSITEVASVVLKIDKVSVWRLSEDRRTLECLDLYDIADSKHHQSRAPLRQELYPKYFAQLMQIRSIVFDIDSVCDGTKELSDKYLPQHGSSSILDAPIHVFGKTAGVLWLESIDDKQKWSLEERSFINSLTDLLSIAFEIPNRREAEQGLQRIQKLEALGKLTGGVAHDFNNMLGIIIGYADLLKLSLSDQQPPLANYADQIHYAAKRGVKLTEKLLSFSRQHQVDARMVNINTILNNQRQLLEKTLTARITLSLNLAEDLWPVWVDIGDLEDTIINISINAMHAMKSGGKFELKTDNHTLTKSEADNLQISAGDYVVIHLTDTGEGMDKSVKARIFDPFFSTKGKLGTGLGLSQVHGFVERINGGIKVVSEPGKGTCFSIYFPRYTGPETTDQVISEIEKIDFTKLRGNETILLVDDEPELLDLANTLLSNQGYNIILAQDAASALEKLKFKQVDLMLTDVIMPGLDGYQLAERVRELYPSVAIQLSSGFTDNRQELVVDKSLHNNLLIKPYNASTLFKRVRSLLDEHKVKQKSTKPELFNAELFVWDQQKMGTGIEVVDRDHKTLFAIMNRCLQLSKQDPEYEEKESLILTELVDYTHGHFKREEIIMQACGYPSLRNHKKTHQFLLKQVDRKCADFNAGRLSSNDLSQFLGDWLIEHIYHLDQGISVYTKGKEAEIEQALRQEGENENG